MHNLKVDHEAVATRMGSKCTARAVQEQLKKLKKASLDEATTIIPDREGKRVLRKSAKAAEMEALAAISTRAERGRGRGAAVGGKKRCASVDGEERINKIVKIAVEKQNDENKENEDEQSPVNEDTEGEVADDAQAEGAEKDEDETEVEADAN